MTQPTYRVSDLPPRLASKIAIDPVTGCWRWTRAHSPKGYGVATYQNRYWRAHRLVWTLLVGAIPDDRPQRDHGRARGCIYKDCCWPAHLEPVTNLENLNRGDWRAWHAATWGPPREAGGEARQAVTPWRDRTHCPQGHPLVPGNLRGGKRLEKGHRECLTCHRDRERERARARARR